VPTYITLAKWTSDGIRKIKESPARLDAFKKRVQSLGGSVKGFYMVAGQHDMVVIYELPDDTAMAKTALATGSIGSITTQTCRAFTEEEYRKIVGELP
jgi:uncharacterized protein with GYD domain